MGFRYNQQIKSTRKNCPDCRHKLRPITYQYEEHIVDETQTQVIKINDGPAGLVCDHCESDWMDVEDYRSMHFGYIPPDNHHTA